MSEPGQKDFDIGTKRIELGNLLERILLAFIAVLVLVLAVSFYQQNIQLREFIESSSSTRSEQLSQLLENQAATADSTEEIKDYIRCVVLVLRSDPSREIETLDNCATDAERFERENREQAPQNDGREDATNSPRNQPTTRQNRTPTSGGDGGGGDNGNTDIDNPYEALKPVLLDTIIDTVSNGFNGLLNSLNRR